MAEIAPSLLSADFSSLYEEVKKVESAGIKYLHFDIMDGHFVPNLTIGAMVVKSLRKKSSAIFDVHLMIENPDNYIEIFKDAGADIITVHQEACVHLHRTIQLIKNTKAIAGVAINPATSIELLEYILPEIDLILVMSVNPGFGGQKFIHTALVKIRALKTLINRKKLNIKIEVDGGINLETIKSVVGAGADLMVAGAAAFQNGDPQKAIQALYAEITK
ncbi:ribulose-phosphate 3-epimerase [Candidatus Desantisbacteria bacterium]|nr:ribulose-phosphate 3-epimerase [Candidatus Desantisbacteria bacterium]